MFVIILNRIFDSDNVGIVTLLVDDINHRSEGRRFTRTRWTGNKNQSLGLPEHFSNRRRKTNLFHCQHLGGNLAQHDPKVAFLPKYAYTETGKFSECKTKVGASAFTDMLNMVF